MQALGQSATLRQLSQAVAEAGMTVSQMKIDSERQPDQPRSSLDERDSSSPSTDQQADSCQSQQGWSRGLWNCLWFKAGKVHRFIARGHEDALIAEGWRCRCCCRQIEHARINTKKRSPSFNLEWLARRILLSGRIGVTGKWVHPQDLHRL
jgi:hypothetical protein